MSASEPITECPKSGSSSSVSAPKGVRVVLRIRKRFADEVVEPVVAHQGDGSVELITDPHGPKPSRAHRTLFNFDGYYGEEATQEALFEEARSLLPGVTRGVNVTIMAYGATGSGKTYTMQGSESAPGIIPRSVRELLALRAAEEAAGESSMRVGVSYLEIYNDRVYDLLAPGKKELAVRQNTDGGVYVAGATEVPVGTPEDFGKAYWVGVGNRTTESTALNTYSSRSHALLMLAVKSRVGDRVYSAKLCLIDLAGSEDNRRTGNTGDRLTESGAINSSLFVLGKCVSAINAGSKRVPFRDSKLTRLLQDSLGGSTQSLMIVAISPGCNHWASTHQTLNFASKSKRIVNVPTVNVAVVVERKQEDAKRILEIAQQARLKRLQKAQAKGQHQQPASAAFSIKATAAALVPRGSSRAPLGALSRPRPSTPSTPATPATPATLAAKALCDDGPEHNKENLLLQLNGKTTLLMLSPSSMPLARRPLQETPRADRKTAPTSRRSQRKPVHRFDLAELLDDGEEGNQVVDDDEFFPEEEDGEGIAEGEEFVAKRARTMGRQDVSPVAVAARMGGVEAELLAYLNSHPLKDIQSLHCIGKKRAELIMACRPFPALESLSQIGLKKASLADFIQRNSASLKMHKMS
ncbi:MAG: kinesin family protein [archaeon]|nr:kinesin family protein [archaeon]